MALDLNLTDAQVAKLNAVSKPALNFPGEINTHLAPPVPSARGEHQRILTAAVASRPGVAVAAVR